MLFYRYIPEGLAVPAVQQGGTQSPRAMLPGQEVQALRGWGVQKLKRSAVFDNLDLFRASGLT